MENINEQDIINFFDDISRIITKEKVSQLQIIANSYKSSQRLTNNVEFWSWMNRNYNGAAGKMFSSNKAMIDYMAQGKEKLNWVYKQLQGKGYEWDWMQQQRSAIQNIFKVYDAGDISNQIAVDVEEYDILSGKNTEYQMKAYISKNNPKLHNTETNVTVVTNAEKTKNVVEKGYSVESFKDKDEIIHDVEQPIDDIESGKATSTYSIKNVGGAMLKSGAVGCILGATTEVIVSYGRWKNGQLSDMDYLSEVLRAGGDTGVTAAATTGIMIPVSSIVTGVGASSLITIPVAFVISAGINKLVAPCFGRGEYRKILKNVHYYQTLESMYVGFMQCVEVAANKYEYFANEIIRQNVKYNQIREKDNKVTRALKDLYDSI